MVTNKIVENLCDTLRIDKTQLVTILNNVHLKSMFIQLILDPLRN